MPQSYYCPHATRDLNPFTLLRLYRSTMIDHQGNQIFFPFLGPTNFPKPCRDQRYLLDPWFCFAQAREKTQISTESGFLSRLYLDGQVLSKPGDLLFQLANNAPNTPDESEIHRLIMEYHSTPEISMMLKRLFLVDWERDRGGGWPRLCIQDKAQSRFPRFTRPRSRPHHRHIPG